MIETLRKRLAREESGFTLIELLVVIIIIGILLAIAVPSYLSFRERANDTAAQANVRAAVPAVEAFYADNGTYVDIDNGAGDTPPGIVSYDQALEVTIDATQSTGSTYCIYSNVGGEEYYKLGPAGEITPDATPGASPCA
jgi:type IV pilus assembly protein PilA